MITATMIEAEKVRAAALVLEEKEKYHLAKLQETYNREKDVRNALSEFKVKVNNDIKGGAMVNTSGSFNN